MKAAFIRALRTTSRHNQFSLIKRQFNATTPSSPSSRSYHIGRPSSIILASTILLLLHNDISVQPIVRAFQQSCKTHRPTSVTTTATDNTDNDDNCNPTATTKTDISTMSDEKKSKDDLQRQWAGGIDIWRAVPLLQPLDETTTLSPTINEDDDTIGGRKITGTVSIQNRVRRPDDVVDRDSAVGPSVSGTDDTVMWPAVVRTSVLYGFGAYNPRGQIWPDDVNREMHQRLQRDIESGVSKDNNQWKGNGMRVVWWEGMSIWEDGSSERGFVIAFGEDGGSVTMTEGERENFQQKALDWVVELATKYDQGAIYRYTFVDVDRGGRLVRDTVAVLDPGTDATVEVIRDDDLDLSSFLDNE